MSDTDQFQSKIQKDIVDLSASFAGLIDSLQLLRSPLRESREKVPKATDQLDKISEQTEAAAHKVLDVVERITNRQEQMIADLRGVREQSAVEGCTELSGKVDKLISRATSNLDDAYLIMETLQFQDITHQQMDHAASLLEDIEGKLHSILTAFGIVEENSQLGEQQSRKKRSYDPHADMSEKRTSQQDIDSLFESKTGR
jgi:chemotaxis regulatin CheY-phosphate phosphatase CheZ